MGRILGIVLSVIVTSAFAGAQTAIPRTPSTPASYTHPAPVEQLFPAESNNTAAYRPLTPREKFHLYFESAKSPYVLADGLITTVSWQMSKNPPFGSGSTGFGEGYGAAIAQREASLLMSRFLIPTLLHQDPRYFPAREGSSKLRRAAYAASRVFLTRSDSGRQTWNASYVMGNLASAGLANAYINNRDAGSIFSDFAVGMGTDAGMNILKEFWPSVRKHVPGKRVKELGDFVIGSNTPPPAGTDVKTESNHLLPRFLP